MCDEYLGRRGEASGLISGQSRRNSLGPPDQLTRFTCFTKSIQYAHLLHFIHHLHSRYRSNRHNIERSHTIFTRVVPITTLQVDLTDSLASRGRGDDDVDPSTSGRKCCARQCLLISGLIIRITLDRGERRKVELLKELSLLDSQFTRSTWREESEWRSGMPEAE